MISRLDFSDTTEAELKKLAVACQPATFGRNDENIFDPTYRKALKLDEMHFAPKFDLAESSIMHDVQVTLLEGHEASKVLRAELYKLNVYGTHPAIPR